VAIKNGLPAAVRETLMPVVNVTDAQFNALPKLADDMAQVLNAVSTDQVATITAVKALPAIIKANMPSGVTMSDADIANLAAKIAPLLPQNAYSGTFTPIPHP
jgi:hypothetical protein